MDFALHGPINNLSFGNVFVCILREIHKRGLEPAIFTIGQDDFTAHQVSDDFKLWVSSCKDRALKSYRRETPVVKLWHLNGSIESFGLKQLLLTFQETDQLTEAEANVIKNNSKVLFSSKYSADIAKTFGCENVDTFPLGFDTDSFHIIKNRQYLDSGVIQFGLAGKMEKRKNHLRIINLWVKKFGNNPKFKLNCAIFNPFLPADVQQNMFVNAVEGKNYWNVNVLPWMADNASYNDFLNSNSAMIDMSSAEGWSLPSFQSACLGKHILALNSTGIKEWANAENSVLVNPTKKIPLYDGVFFQEGQPFGQGSGFDFTDEAFYEGIDKLIKRIEKQAVNEAGLMLQDQFTYAKTVDKILALLENL